MGICSRGTSGVIVPPIGPWISGLWIEGGLATGAPTVGEGIVGGPACVLTGKLLVPMPIGVGILIRANRRFFHRPGVRRARLSPHSGPLCPDGPPRLCRPYRRL
jgi:hypothetical protein